MSEDNQDNDNSNPLKMTKGDHAHTGVRAIISAIPVVGSPFDVIFSRYYPSPIDKRRDDLLQSVAQGLEKLRDKYDNLTPESLVKDDAFVSVLLNAVSIAIKTHQKEKLDALRNAVLNTAKEINIDENLQLVFLRYIDNFTPLHMKLLALFDGPQEYLDNIGRPFPTNIVSTGLDRLVERAFPELVGKRELAGAVFKDLYNNGLVNTESIGGTMSVSSSGIFAQRTTGIGQQFLRYIAAPPELIQ